MTAGPKRRKRDTRAIEPVPLVGYLLRMETLLLRVAAKLPRPARQAVTPARAALAAQFARFGTVGVAGLIVDVSIVYTLRGRCGLYLAGLASYLVAATVTWIGNRLWTFKQVDGAAHRQWILFLLANTIGFVLNRGTYAALVTWSPFCAALPVLPVAAGAVAGMLVNFTLARTVVFR